MSRLLSLFLPVIVAIVLSQAQATAITPLVVSAGQVVTLSADTTVAGVTVFPGGELRFDPAASVTLSSTANVVISGTLTMRPVDAGKTHTLRFVGINEANFVGGGMEVLASDVGLWVMGAGKLDIVGAPKVAWTRAVGSIPVGAQTITLPAAPVGWRVGDEIAIAPTESIAVGTRSWWGFDQRTITAINGATITLNVATVKAHPSNTDPSNGAIYTAEVMNLTRNVNIEGTEAGKAHLFIHSSAPQSISYATLRYMGPGKLGRYPLHFHLTHGGSVGSLILGVAIWDTDGHAAVPHGADGITFRDLIIYKGLGDGLWWDKPTCTLCNGPNVNDSNDLLIDHSIAANITYEPNNQGYRITGFLLGRGEGNIIQNSTAVGIGGVLDASGFGWPETDSGIWGFCGDLAHNNAADGIFVWQNNTEQHIICNFVAYNNQGAGVDHGAYGNVYGYPNLHAFGNKYDVVSRAASNLVTRPDGYGQAWEGLRIGGIFFSGERNQGPAVPILVKDCTIGKVIVDEHDKARSSKIDFVNCTKPNGLPLEAADFQLVFAYSNSRYRVQRQGGTAFQVAGSGVVTTIAPFYMQ